MEEKEIHFGWMSGCCLTPIQQFFSYIMTRNFQRNDDEVRFALDQHAELDDLILKR
jgi:hypothetical protein